MYSPKIKPDLIPMLYRIKQAQGGKPALCVELSNANSSRSVAEHNAQTDQNNGG